MTKPFDVEQAKREIEEKAAKEMEAAASRIAGAVDEAIRRLEVEARAVEAIGKSDVAALYRGASKVIVEEVTPGPHRYGDGTTPFWIRVGFGVGERHLPETTISAKPHRMIVFLLPIDE